MTRNIPLQSNEDKHKGIIKALKILPARRKGTEIDKWLNTNGFDWIPATLDPSWRLLTDRGVGQSINMFIEAHMGGAVDTLVGLDKLHTLKEDG